MAYPQLAPPSAPPAHHLSPPPLGVTDGEVVVIDAAVPSEAANSKRGSLISLGENSPGETDSRVASTVGGSADADQAYSGYSSNRAIGNEETARLENAGTGVAGIAEQGTVVVRETPRGVLSEKTFFTNTTGRHTQLRQRPTAVFRDRRRQDAPLEQETHRQSLLGLLDRTAEMRRRKAEDSALEFLRSSPTLITTEQPTATPNDKQF